MVRVLANSTYQPLPAPLHSHFPGTPLVIMITSVHLFHFKRYCLRVFTSTASERSSCSTTLLSLANVFFFLSFHFRHSREWYIIVVSLCISMMSNEVKLHFHMLVICISSFIKCLFKFSCSFFCLFSTNLLEFFYSFAYSFY